MNLSSQYSDTVNELQKLMKRSPRSSRAIVLQERATKLLATILQKGERKERKAKKPA
ncbi:hypothetical protein [Tardiphaga sp. 841_E9_N1_2]|uniref:hypothetical protein n=1 Tax=Tardiphaga sp. 841_E9_N1_2 TaxID=3240762 RepID=UPI003F2806FA